MNKAMQELAVEMLQEVYDSHRDKESCDYNECEIDECLWCHEAGKVIKSQ